MGEGGARPTYHRVLLKLSGEAFAPASGSGISDASTGLIARQLAEVVDIGIQPAVVVGGGNIWRGPAGAAASSATAPITWGCSPPIMNALALQDALEKIHVADAGAVRDRDDARSPSRSCRCARSVTSRRAGS